jgi:hypothetical protein
MCWQEQTVPRQRSNILLQKLQQMHSQKSRQRFLPTQIPAKTQGLGWPRLQMCAFLVNHCANEDSSKETVWYIEDVAGKAVQGLKCTKLYVLFGNVHMQLANLLASYSIGACISVTLERRSRFAWHCRLIFKSLGQCPGWKSWLGCFVVVVCSDRPCVLGCCAYALPHVNSDCHTSCYCTGSML